MLLGFAANAQEVTYTCRYWFDQNHAQTAVTTFGESGWEAELDVGSLTFGLHSLHLHVMDTSMKWSAPQSYLFLKIDAAGQGGTNYAYHYWFDQDFAHKQSGSVGNGHLLLDVDALTSGLHSLHLMVEGSTYSTAQSYLFLKADPAVQGGDNFVYHCWFDQDFAHQQSDALGTGHLLLDVADLEEGLHTVHVLVEGTQLTATQSYLFMKAAQFATDTIDMSHLSCRCWFDQDFEHQQIDSLGDGHLLLDVNDLEDGLHTVHVMLQGSTLTATQSYIFMKMAVEDPSSEMQYVCWFDQDYSSVQTGPLGSSLFELEVSDLPNGIHTVNVQVDKGTRSAPQCYLFYKQPLGGYGIARWEYWLNDDFDNRTTTVFSTSVDSLDIVTLLPVGHPDIRSSCFHFHPNGDAPYINAKNKISFRFFDTEIRFVDREAYFVDEQVQQDIVAQVFERNTTETFAAPRDNQIQWFKLEANIGDSLAFVADKACTMQLFAPSGEEVYAATASEAMVLGGCHAWEDGTYYLAVHDVTGSGETVSVTYNWVYRYAILAYDVHLVGNGGCSTITFQGNGFNSLLDVYLVNAQNDSIRPRNIGHESNSTTTVTFNFYEVNLGMYDAVFLFVDDVIQIHNAIQVEEATPFAFDASVTFANQFLRTTSNKYVFQVHNYSNMTAYDVPLAVYIYTPDAESLTRVDIEGFDVKAYIRNLYGSHYTDSLDNVIEQKRLTSGDLFGFLEDPNTDYVPDAPYEHRVFLTPTLRPNTTETFTIAVQSTGTVSVYMWYPEGWENRDSIGNMPITRSAYDGICAIANERKRMCDANEEVGYQVYNVNCDDLPKPSRNCPPPPGGPSTPVNSLDPNDIHGYLSESGSHYMRQEIQNVQYEIEFENDTTLATAAAHTIIVRDTLDASKFDLNSLAARSVTIGDKRLELNGEQTFARTLDMRPELYVIAQIEQDYDPTTGIVEWTIQSLDPMTMEPTDNPYQGVLPVNYNGNGVGFIDYSVNLKETFADGTEISNRAGIIFDQNDVIMTPTWTNIVDAVKPTSHIESADMVNDSLSFSFVSEDNRSGVWYHTLYYRNDSTAMEWQVKKPQIHENVFMLRFDDFQTTEYLVMAVDSAGNVEEKDMVAEYIYYYDGPGPASQTDNLSAGWNWWSTYVEMNGTNGLEMLQNSLGHNGLSIKSQNDFTDNYYQDMGEDYWYGSMENLRNEQSYLINVMGNGEVTLSGSAAIPMLHPITIQPNWNWIGYPVSVPQTVSGALAGFNPSGDDVLKGQADFASYYEGFGWYPDDFMLMPGQGYLYLSNATESKTLTYAGGSRGWNASKVRKDANAYWSNDIHAFADNLSVIAVVSIDSVEQRNENLELGAFVNGECRGSARLRYFAPLDRYYAMLTVAGRDGENVEFHLVDIETQEGVERSQSQLVFSRNAVVGNFDKPFEASFGGVYEGLWSLSLYPNPVGRNTAFSLNVPQNEAITEIVITDVLGTVLRHETGAVNAKSIKGLPTAGVYLIQAVAKSGTTYRGRLIVE